MSTTSAADTVGGRLKHTNSMPLYLDHHATTPVAPEVLEAMLPYFSNEFGNASSKDHIYGARSDAAVGSARADVAHLIGAKEEEIIFTSGATEANNLALFGVMESYADRGDHLITCVTEHKAVLDSARRLESLGKRVTYLQVDQLGSIDLDDLRRAITPHTVLITIMAANNEIGTLAPLKEIGKIAREHEVLFHTDATQAVGHIPIDVEEMHIDLLSCSAHKLYGPKGVGALFLRRRRPKARLTPQIWGGGHERGNRSGTLNVPGIVGFGRAARIASKLLPTESARVTTLRDALFDGLRTEIDGVEVNGPLAPRLPHNANLWIPRIDSRSLIVRLPDIAFSAGAACTSERIEPSHVIMALGMGPERAHRSIRLGLGRSTTSDNIQYVVERLAEEVALLNRFHG